MPARACALPSCIDGATLPVLLFSHGMGGNRLIYSHLCTSLASHGVFVVAVEHTDGLGSAARLANKRCGPTPLVVVA